MGFLITFLVIAIKAYWDNKNWGKVDHTKGIVLVSLILIPLSIIVKSPYPIFLFGMLWNPVINTVRRLPLFYVGNTATIDIALNFLFGKKAGEVFALMLFVLFICSVYEKFN